ncbi:MAG TPA: 4Fe-4S dicluster domain-containing protein [Thermoanaerobaculia bacterium]|nr:4Fe-4S dicluster domain-containing protein [Thermoanaerobaculia bacterium]
MKSSANSGAIIKRRFGLVIDLDRCNGCGACATACAVENNVPPAFPEVNERTGLTWMRVYRAENGRTFPDSRTVYFPISCQHCGHDTPCVSVCPQNAVDINPQTGVVSQIPERCLGCRYCMAACPYHARYFNWFDPTWPAGMEKTLNPDVSVRMRGVVEKCNLCHSRWQVAKAKAAAAGKQDLDPADYTTACAEACPAKAIVLGDLDDRNSEASRAAKSPNAFRLLAKLGTDPKIYYRSNREWVRRLGDADVAQIESEASRG